MKISLLHATRGTPERALKTRQTWLDRANDASRVEHIFAVQADDELSLSAFADLPCAVTEPPPEWASSSVANWNAAAAMSTGDMLVVIADDLTPYDDWDADLCKLPSGDSRWSCYVPDNIRSDGLMCHPVLSRALYRHLRHVFSPDYFGVFCDNDFTTAAALEGAIYQVHGLEWQHDHPIAGAESNPITAHQNTNMAYAFGGTVYCRRWPLVDQFTKAQRTPGDINEHLLRIAQLARECDHVTEFGVRTGLSTLAILHGLSNKPEATLRSYDLADPYGVFDTARDVVSVQWTFTHGSTLDVSPIEPTQMLFVDTLHTYAQVKGELERHAANVSKYIVFHDTVSFGVTGEDGGAGINLAIQEFLRDYPQWVIFEHYDNNNGLTILTRQ
jgi:hypothetical protein